MNRVEPATRARGARRTGPDWWRGAVIYQIYPRSFQDTNGDGIGDLAGIRDRLPYVAALGVDAIWISPFYPSPMLDFGYDVTDYEGVDPMFGTLADFDALVARAHDLGLRVLIDLVLSHTSDLHPWFVESRASRENPKADWFVWADPRPDGTPPNNWLSIFGGVAWEWDGERMQYYLHNFLTSQPDLNFHNDEVQQALLDVAQFWLDRGVDGFRLDTVNFYVQDAELRDNPPLAVERRNETAAPSVNPYNFQEHLYDKNRPETLDFLRRLRALLDRYPGATTVGEIGEGHRGAELQAEYTSGSDKLHMCYDFEFLSSHPPTGLFFGGVLERANRLLIEGWPCWAFSNHDVMRHATRWGLPDAGAKVFAALLVTMRGSVCLYQGEELGLGEAEITRADLQDPYGKKFWPRFRGRDGCRTPMPWTADPPVGGFTRGRPWLPMPPEHLDRAVAAQEGEPESILTFYRRLLAWRAGHAVLATGGLAVHSATQTTLVFTRDSEATRIACAFNIGPEPAAVSLPPGDWRADPDAPWPVALASGEVDLAPWSASFALEDRA